jgi:hypothetical protein
VTSKLSKSSFSQNAAQAIGADYESFKSMAEQQAWSFI